MARSTAAFERIIDLAVARVKPPEFQKLHAEIARKGLAEHLAGLNGPPPEVVTYVDGRRGLSEDTVKPYGVIRYDFHRLAEVAAFALRRCRELSPVKEGRYQESWFVMAASRQVADGAIPNTGELIMTNDQPYHRKLEMTVNADHWRGKARARLPAGIVERVRQEVRREFGRTVEASISFITLQGGYVLKGRAHLKPAKQSRRSRAYRAGRKHLAPRKDTAVGQPMTYPAIFLRSL
ncbi:hypothetical protein [Azospirillum canadense]|uniref:hypothetical protein n=1 Tax=Azospirillum canadense TaxID=403962 RepID=UPI002227E86F|nr:hypothetical protein [Azospirillum canadense]MCW2243579.1 hypothetical protein [Azospirillum canadense]